jgi:hypothetical protein
MLRQDTRDGGRANQCGSVVRGRDQPAVASGITFAMSQARKISQGQSQAIWGAGQGLRPTHLRGGVEGASSQACRNAQIALHPQDGSPCHSAELAVHAGRVPGLWTPQRRRTRRLAKNLTFCSPPSTTS